MVKRASTVAAVISAVCLSLWTGSAASQETTTTTVDPAATTTTTVDPGVTTTTVDPAAATTTTTEDPAATTTTVPLDGVVVPPVPAPILLFGETITAGTLDVMINWHDPAPTDCVTTIPLDGGQINRVNDIDGDLGLVYGQAATTGGTAAVFLMEFGAIPAGLGIVSIEDGTCSVDAMGVGAYEKGPGYAALTGFGVGVYPGDTEGGSLVENFNLTANVGASTPSANLDTTSLTDFLLRARS